MQSLFTLRWLGLLGLVLISLPSRAQQTTPGPGFPGGPGPIQLPPVVVTSPTYYPAPAWSGSVPYPGWNQPWVGYNPSNAPRPDPCPGDIMKNPQSIAPSKPGNYNGGTYGFTRKNTDQSPKFHDGLDIYAPPGTPFVAAYGGTVTRVERNFSPDQYAEGSYGNFVQVTSIVNGQTLILKYNHMDQVNPNIVLNAVIRAGAPIGLSGTTGNAGTNPNAPAGARAIIPHVHIQARDANGKTNPEPHLSTKFDHTNGQAIIRPC